MKNLKNISKKKLAVILAFIILLIVFLSVGIYLQTRSTSSAGNNPQAEIQDLTTKVGKLMDLPVGEQPVVATVSDVSKLSGQPFFANAQNGDKVLAYNKAQKAILYRPSTNKIIEVTFYNPPSDTSSASSSASAVSPTPPAAKTVNVYVYNGTKTAGLAKTKGTELENKFSNISIKGTGNASGDFEETIVVDLNNSNKTLASDIAKQLGGKVGNLPTGEEKPTDSDILVILGSK